MEPDSRHFEMSALIIKGEFSVGHLSSKQTHTKHLYHFLTWAAAVNCIHSCMCLNKHSFEYAGKHIHLITAVVACKAQVDVITMQFVVITI